MWGFKTDCTELVVAELKFVFLSLNRGGNGSIVNLSGFSQDTEFYPLSHKLQGFSDVLTGGGHWWAWKGTKVGSGIPATAATAT
jgi:hypothetical protein